MAGFFGVTKFFQPPDRRRGERVSRKWPEGGRDTRHYTRFLLAIISSMAYATLFTPPADHSLALPRVLRKAIADTQCSASEWKSVVVENVGGKMRNLWATTRPRVRGSWGPGSGCAFVFMQHLWCHLQFSNIVVLLKELQDMNIASNFLTLISAIFIVFKVWWRSSWLICNCRKCKRGRRIVRNSARKWALTERQPAFVPPFPW